MDIAQRVKHPRTPHLPWSLGATQDDERWNSCGTFLGQEVVALRKMDGENFVGYPDGFCHARSVDGRAHPTQDWARAAWGRRAHLLAPFARASCENLWAVHSLRYTDLPSYLMGFALWDQNGDCLDWDTTVIGFAGLNLPTVDVLWRGVWDERAVRALHRPADDARHEGYVVRLASGFALDAFGDSVAKCVRPNHVTTDRHWRKGPWEANGLAPNATGW